MKVQIREVKSKLSKYGDLAHRGQRIVVSKNGVPWFDLVPHQQGKRRTKPLDGAAATVDESQATAPVDARDLEGWI